MSRAYRIAVSESVERIVHVEDGVATTLELLPILAKERQADILADELAQRGFERDDQSPRTMVRETETGVTVEVDLDTGTVKATVTSQADVKRIVERSGSYLDPKRAEEGRAELEQKARAQAEREIAAEEERLRREATRRLEEELRDLRAELDGVVNRTTARALKERAAQVGEIEELLEDPETGSLTIKVRL
jgi:hypothetical protein